MRGPILALVGLLCALACRAEVSAVDDSGRKVTLTSAATRVISLAPHLTELVFAIGAGEAVKGVIRFSDHPAAARTLPLVGDAFALDFETIARLKPDLVLVWGSGQNERHKARLRGLGLTLFESDIRKPEAIADTMRRLGTLLGQGANAARAAADFEQTWQSLRERHAGKPPLRVFWQLWNDPLMTVNREHLIGAALVACGATNVFGELPLLTPTVAWEAAVAADPQLIVGSGGAQDSQQDFARWRRFTQVSAVRRGQFARIDGDLIGRMGPRFVRGAAALCDAVDRARAVP